MTVLSWTVVLISIAIAAGFFVAWQRARRERAGADRAAAQAQQAIARAEAQASERAAQVVALYLAQPDGVLLLDSQRTLVNLNPAASAMFGPAARPGQSLIAATRSVELDELAAHALAGGADCDRQVALGNGAQPYRARAVPVGENGVYGVALILIDQSELQRLGRARRDFVANISHELRTPITSIRLLVDTLQSQAVADPETRSDLLAKIAVETETLSQLSQELLDLAQIESGQAMVRLVPASVAQLAAEVVERLAPQAERKRQTVAVEIAPDLTALADVDQVKRALGNLLHNAIKFTPPTGSVSVRAAAQEGDVMIEVADTGPGISPQDLPRVFERFFRGDRSRPSGGTGLGLAIAKHVVEAHGGRIWVESEGRPGHGAVFRFTLPMA
jgi:two-component system phosphate regulon sensor histidine kinase PhoR